MNTDHFINSGRAIGCVCVCVCVCVRTITFELNDLKAEASTEETPTQSGHTPQQALYTRVKSTANTAHTLSSCEFSAVCGKY